MLRKQGIAPSALIKEVTFVAAWNNGGYCRTSRSLTSHDPYLHVDDSDKEEDGREE